MVCGVVILMLLVLVMEMKFLGVAWEDPTFKIAGQYWWRASAALVKLPDWLVSTSLFLGPDLVGLLTRLVILNTLFLL